jgi:hypothetical protein
LPAAGPAGLSAEYLARYDRHKGLPVFRPEKERGSRIEFLRGGSRGEMAGRTRVQEIDAEIAASRGAHQK